PAGAGLLEPHAAELAVGAARRGVDGGPVDLPAPARLPGVQAGRRGPHHDGRGGVTRRPRWVIFGTSVFADDVRWFKRSRHRRGPFRGWSQVRLARPDPATLRRVAAFARIARARA